MSLQEFMNKFIRKDNRVKEIIEERRAQRLAEQREKPSNERELERFIEERRQEKIKMELERFRKQRQKETWSSNALDKKYMFKDKRPILKEKNIFKDNKNIILKSSR